jgi:hypothetical protein
MRTRMTFYRKDLLERALYSVSGAAFVLVGAEVYQLLMS